MKFSPRAGLAAFLATRKGNVGIIFAIAALPVILAVGGGVDYAVASRIETQLYAAADAAILAATTPAMMQQSSTVAKTAAISMFASQASQIKRFIYNASGLNVTVTDATVSGSTTRTVAFTYQAQVSNAFGALYRIPASNFTVTTASTATTARNIDFYLLLDNSPSMELPATADGVAAMNAFGCAFACHENNLSDGEYSTPYKGFGTIDSYTYAENNGIALRIDNVRTAAKNLASTAQQLMASNGATYRLAAYGFNYSVTPIQNLLATTSANVATIQSNVAAMTPPIMDSNNNLAGNQSYTYPTGATTYTTVALGSGALNTADAMTDIGMAMSQINSVMPTPGNGTKAVGDTPQSVLMLVTDGVNDSSLYSSASCTTSVNWGYSNSYGSFDRCLQPIDTSFCATIKKRGIRIAVLYTTYFPVTTNSFYNATVAAFLPDVSTNLKSCASSAELFFEVDTGGDISAALATLFQKAVSTAAHITQ